MKHLTLILNLCITALLATAPPTRAAPRDLSAEIRAHRAEFVSAKVYYTTSIKPEGCHYDANGTGLSILLDELIRAGLHEPPPVPDGVEHTAIYLATRDGRTVALRLTASDAASTAFLDWMHQDIGISPSNATPCADSVHVYAR